jgi:hypothetical protein
MANHHEDFDFLAQQQDGGCVTRAVAQQQDGGAKDAGDASWFETALRGSSP